MAPAAGENAAAAAPCPSLTTPSKAGFPHHHKTGGSEGEGEQTAEQDRSRPDPVRERPEYGFEQHFRPVIHRQQ
jgi:hypothetical protein